jgi:hypothetical protein
MSEVWVLNEWMERLMGRQVTGLLDRDTVEDRWIWYSWGEVRLSPLVTPATSEPILQTPDDDKSRVVCKIINGGGNQSTRRRTVRVPLCPP